MAIFEEWCKFECTDNHKKRLWSLEEKNGGRAAVRASLIKTVRSHYDDLERIAEDVQRLGYDGAAAVLRERLPQTKKARSGELGEILATELVEEKLEYAVPVRRLRYKDGREMALRGDDFVGLRDDGQHLNFLKGEAKSRQHLSKATIDQARTALGRDDGRPTATSLLFVADRLLELEGADADLGRKLRDEVARRAVPAGQIEHMLFTVSGNVPLEALDNDLKTASEKHKCSSINLHIEDHQEFIADVFEGASKLGDS
jgi:Cap4 SAVED domain